MLQQLIDAPGVMPIFLGITPITNLPMFLGLVDTEEEMNKVALQLSLLSVMDRKNLA